MDAKERKSPLPCALSACSCQCAPTVRSGPELYPLSSHIREAAVCCCSAACARAQTSENEKEWALVRLRPGALPWTLAHRFPDAVLGSGECPPLQEEHNSRRWWRVLSSADHSRDPPAGARRDVQRVERRLRTAGESLWEGAPASLAGPFSYSGSPSVLASS